MKFLYLVPLIFTISLGQNLVDSEDMDVELSEILTATTLELFSDLIKRLVIKSEIGFFGSSSANLNDYVDQHLLPNINQAILDNNLDPIPVPDQKIKFIGASSTLSEGTLSKLATMERYQDVTLTYDSASRKININFILRWEDIELLFKYHTKALLIKINGQVKANLAHMKVHLNLGYSFVTNHVSVDKLDFNHTGDINLKFTGNKLVDWLTNAMTKAFTTIFHNLILQIVKNVIMDPVKGIVDEINETIDNILKTSV